MVLETQSKKQNSQMQRRRDKEIAGHYDYMRRHKKRSLAK